MNELFVVTGGGTGMGREVSLRLVAGADDAEVIVVGRRRAPLDAVVDVGAGRIEAVTADVSGPAGVEELRAAVGDRRVAGIVTAAGGQGDFLRGDDPAPAAVRERWDGAMLKNFYSALLPVESLAPQLSDQRGRVVLIGSTAGLDGQGGPYAAAKAALTGYGMDLARRLGPRGITVNVVAPGFVGETDFFEAGGLGAAGAATDSAAAQTLVGRVGTPGDVAHVVTSLLAEDAGWITGQVVSPNGGTVLVH